MTSPSPLLYDTYYHIYNRGNNRENIFIQERNYTHFMNLYAKYIDPIAETYGYCLLRNHFHVLVRIKPEEEILSKIQTFRVSKTLKIADIPSKKFSDFFNAYAKAINSAYGRSGSLFQHPFGRVPVASERQFWNVIAYIHQNPQKHKFVDDFRDWSYSSYGVLISERPTKLQRELVLDWFGGKEQYVKLHEEWVTDADSKWFAEDDRD
jgi:putative transposase